MVTSISKADKEKFDGIRKKLVSLGSKESSFIFVELLFYEAITIARNYGNDYNDNHLLAALKNIEATYYKSTKNLFRKANQREVVIKHFLTQFKNVLNNEIKLSVQ